MTDVNVGAVDPTAGELLTNARSNAAMQLPANQAARIKAISQRAATHRPGAPDALMDNSRQQALGSLPPDLAARAAQQPIPGPGPSELDISSQTPPPGYESLAPSDTPPPGAENPFDAYAKPPEGAEVPTGEAKTHGNGDFWSASNLGDFLRDEKIGEQAKTAIPRLAGSLGQATTTLLGMPIALAADKVADWVSDKKYHNEAEDWVGDWIKTQKEFGQDQTPQYQEGSGKVGGMVGTAVQVAPMMLLGGVPAAVTFGTQAGINTATESLDKGQSLRAAAGQGAVDAVANAIQPLIAEAPIPKMPGVASDLLNRVLFQVPAGDLAAVAGDVAKKKILESNGYQKEADAIDPITNIGEDTLQNLVFAALGGKSGSKEKPLPKTATAPPEAQPIPQQPPVAKPLMGTPAEQIEAKVGKPLEISPAASHPVGDTPSPEPAKDLRAQFIDMNSAVTPRVGVLVPKGAEVAAGKYIEQAKAQGRVVDLPQGTLVLRNKAEWLKARREIDNTGETEALIGRVTGAGEGKSPDQTAVVQGHKGGAVASESMVTPAEVPAKVAQMQAEGKEPVVTTPEAAVQRRQTEIAAEAQTPPEGAEHTGEEEESAAPTAKRAIVKTAAGERAVVLEGEPENGQQKVRLLDEEGEPSEQIVSVPAESVKSGSETAMPEPPAKEATPEPAKPAPEVKASPKAAMLDQLRDAAADFEKSQQPAPGRKFAGSVKDRAGDVAGFARTLKAVAERVGGVDGGDAIARANEAARLDLKSDEALAKNQGVGHTELSVHTENLLNAARKLLDPDFKKPEPKIARQEKLKAKVAAKKLAPEPPHHYEMNQPEGLRTKEEIEAFNDRVLGKKPKEKPAEKVKVIEDVLDETKPHELTKGEQLKLKAVGDRLIKAKDENVDAHTADVDRILHEIYGERMPKDDRDAFISYLLGERRDRLRPKRMSDEIEDELGAKGVDYRSAEPDEFEARVLGAHEVSPEMASLHANLERSGMYPRMREMASKGQYAAKAIYQHMASVAPEGALRDFITKLGNHQPEGAVVRPVDAVKHRDAEVAGLARLSDNSIQVRMKAGGDTRLTHALLHEGVHLATMHLMRAEPDHPLVREAQRLYRVFGDRMVRRLGADVIAQHIDYHRGTGPKPTDLINNLYGLHSPAEFMAEAMSNPKFQQLIGESEKWRDKASEGFLGGAHKLADAVVGAIQRALGLIGKRQAQLLHSVMRNVEDVMEAQRSRLDAERLSAAHDLSDIAALNHDPKPLKDEPRLRSIVGRTGSVLARQFYRATQGHAVPALRKLVLADETHDQIVRSNSHWFGEDNEKNPLRQYDSAMDDKNAIINRHLERARPVVLERQKLNRRDDTALGNLQSDSTRWGIDPSKDKADVQEKYTKAAGFNKRWDDLQERWKALPEQARHVYQEERDHYAWAQKQLRRTAVDAALDTFTDRDITAAQRSLLYSARTKGDFESLVGGGKLVDVGDRNDSLRTSLQELAATNNISGPYFHLGRHGEYVVQVHPDVDQSFDSQSEAEAHAQKIRDMGPGSKAKVAELGGKWNVSGSAQYVSMHRNRIDAEAEAQRLRDEGHKVGAVTQKIEAESGGALTKGMQTLIGEATRKLAKRGDGPEVKAMSDALRGTFVQMIASRSAYAASKLSRAGYAGVKGEEMGRNFASHSQSMAWNIGNLATTFKQGEALGRIREMSKRPEEDVAQKTVYKRGAVMSELGKRLGQEVSQYGLRNPANAVIAKLGYMNFLASPSHTGIYLTQNFTTAYPVAGARWGYGKALSAFTRATQAVVGPAMRATIKAAKPGEFGADDMVAHVIQAIKQHPEMGKWADNLRELMDRGIITNTFAHEVGHQATGGNATVQRVFDYARIMPQMAEVYNRVSTALAGLEMTGGDIRKTADFINETHVNYAQSNKTRVGKWLAKVPGGNAMTMFHTYIQGMRHLLYSNIKNMAFAETKSRAEAAKTVAGLVVAMSISAGVIKGAALEPLRGAVYAYNKIFGNDDEFYSLDNSIRRFVTAAVGNKKISDAITGGIPHLLGFDLSSRMGLSDLFLHDPPDLLAADKKEWLQFLGEQLGGPMGQMVGEQKDAFMGAMNRGNAFEMLSSLVPIKILRDAAKAGELATTGKRGGNGAQLTKPSVADAVTQVMGFKPADVARVQQRQGDVAQYRQFIGQRKDAILGAWAKAASPDERKTLRTTINDFNAKNPGDRIKVQDLIKQQRSALKSQQRLETGNDANPNIRKLLNY